MPRHHSQVPLFLQGWDIYYKEDCEIYGLTNEKNSYRNEVAKHPLHAVAISARTQEQNVSNITLAQPSDKLSKE